MLLTATAAVLVAVVCVFAFRSSLWVYWYTWKLESDDPEARRAAADELRKLRSPRAVPALLTAALRDEPTHEPRPARRRTRGLGDQSEGPSVFVLAILETGAQALRPLLEAYREGGKETQKLALDLTQRIPPDSSSVATFLWVLERDDLAEIHSFAIVSLGELGPAAAEAVPHLLALLRSESNTLRLNSVEALRMISTTLRDFQVNVSPILELLADPDTEVRAEAAYTLGCFGPQAAAALPDLEKLLHDEDSRVANSAAWALERIRRSVLKPRPLP